MTYRFDMYTLFVVGSTNDINVGTHTVLHSIARDAIHSLTHSLVYHSLFSKHRIAHTLGIALETENDRMKTTTLLRCMIAFFSAATGFDPTPTNANPPSFECSCVFLSLPHS